MFPSAMSVKNGYIQLHGYILCLFLGKLSLLASQEHVLYTVSGGGCAVGIGTAYAWSGAFYEEYSPG